MIHFPGVKQGSFLKLKGEENTYLNEVEVERPSVVSISEESEELRPYNHM
jgi:hypothetical protein